MKAGVATLAKTPIVITFRRVGVETPGKITTALPRRKREKRLILTCHYCNKRGHVRPRCYQYFADLRRENQERFPPRRLVKQEWVKKYESKCYVARTPMKVVEEINIKKKIFRGKHSESGRIPSFFIFICLFLGEKGE